MTYTYTINVQPATKKNSQQILMNRDTGRPFVAQSENYKVFERAAGYFLYPKPNKPISEPVTVKCVFFTKTHRRVDKANLEAAVHDILVKYGILADDNRDIIASTDGSRVFYDRDNPRVEITITPLEEQYEQWNRRDK
jgi:Holliday junction resolvase RusA-like endonuclease